jgi:hypothetical protein
MPFNGNSSGLRFKYARLDIVHPESASGEHEGKEDTHDQNYSLFDSSPVIHLTTLLGEV